LLAVGSMADQLPSFCKHKFRVEPPADEVPVTNANKFDIRYKIRGHRLVSIERAPVALVFEFISDRVTNCSSGGLFSQKCAKANIRYQQRLAGRVLPCAKYCPIAQLA
jgi:hypothetical protein